MSNGTKVKKRNGSIEPLNLEKMHVMVEQACEGLAGVSASQVEINSGIQFYDGITTGEIQEILIRSASDLIDLDHPNYQFVAARLLLFASSKVFISVVTGIFSAILSLTSKSIASMSFLASLLGCVKSNLK